LPVGHTGQGQVHAHLRALALEVLTQALEDLLGSALGHAYHVLSGPALLAGLLHDLLLGGLADGAEIGRGLALVYVTTDGTNKLLHANTSSSFFSACMQAWHLP